MGMDITLLAILGHGGDSRGKNAEIIFLVGTQYAPIADTFFRSSRLVGIEGIFPPAKSIPTILPSHASLQGEGGKKTNLVEVSHLVLKQSWHSEEG